MSNLLFIFLILSFLGGIITFYLWDKINYKWLTQTTRFLVLSLPFERIPSIDTPLGNFRISQFLILFALYLISILIFKKEPKLLQTKLDFSHLLAVLFFIFSIPSWFFILDFNRFLVYIIATSLVFLAYFLISLFLENPVKTIKELTLIMFLLGIFGFYQIIGDFLNIPYQLTGLRETYTKINFGMARIHTTAIEPLYYAGMLFLPLFLTIMLIINNEAILELKKYPRLERCKNRILAFFELEKLLKRFNLMWAIQSKNFTFLVFIVILANFVLTLSKGAWLSMAIVLPFFVWTLFKHFQLIDFLKRFSNFLYIVFFISVFSFFYVEEFSQILVNLQRHFISVIEFNTATSVERLEFITTAFKILPNNIITGIGPGQYGVWYSLVGNLNRFEIITNPITEIASITPRISQIVNNVYIEVWLEFGLFSFLIFIGFLAFLVFTAYKNIFLYPNKYNPEKTAFNSIFKQSYLAVFFSLIAYLIQWNFFSPIYIMSIFILLGLIQRLNRA